MLKFARPADHHSRSSAAASPKLSAVLRQRLNWRRKTANESFGARLVNHSDSYSIGSDPVVRALAGDASSSVYGGSLREIGVYPNACGDRNEPQPQKGHPVGFLLGAVGFMIIAMLFW